VPLLAIQPKELVDLLSSELPQLVVADKLLDNPRELGVVIEIFMFESREPLLLAILPELAIDEGVVDRVRVRPMKAAILRGERVCIPE
jgi:hypothetical protein